MNTAKQPSGDKLFIAKALEATIHVGLVGLFVGAIIFALGIKLFLLWLHENPQTEKESRKSE